MVRRSTLVYDLLRSEGLQSDGISPKEILDRVSQDHNIAPGKGLKKQINVALRRGIDFGILTRQRNKYRFHLNFPSIFADNVERSTKKKSQPKKKLKPAKPKKGKKTKKHDKKHNKRALTQKSTEEDPPRPRVLPPPNWTPKKRNLREEPIPKFIRHSDLPPIIPM